MRRREFPLTLDEQDRIDELEEAGLNVSEIARYLSRSRRSITYYLNHKESHSEEDPDHEMQKPATQASRNRG